jgi:hypothetical protein
MMWSNGESRESLSIINVVGSNMIPFIASKEREKENVRLILEKFYTNTKIPGLKFY